MIREPIEVKIKQKTNGRKAMKQFIEDILKIEETGKQYKSEYKSGIKNAVHKEDQVGY